MLNYQLLDSLFRALAHPTRRWIFELLCCHEELSVGQLTEPLPISQSAVLQHLRVLESAGLMQSEKDGTVRRCRVDPQGLRLLERWMREQCSEFERRQPGGSAWMRH